MFKHIMVPVDLGHLDRLERALKVAADLAKHYDAQITYVGVTFPQPSSIAHNPKEFGEKLAKFAAAQGEIQEVAKTSSETVISHDPTIDMDSKLVEAAHKLKTDLVVMGSHIPKAFEMRTHGGHLASLTDMSIMLVRE